MIIENGKWNINETFNGVASVAYWPEYSSIFVDTKKLKFFKIIVKYNIKFNLLRTLP